jgi:hypothetical protein
VGASTSWNPKGLFRPAMGLLYVYLYIFVLPFYLCLLLVAVILCLGFLIKNIARSLITNKMHKESFIINCNTLVHVLTLLGHLQGVQARTTESSRLQKQRSTQSTAHSHSAIKCNLSVTITKVLAEGDPAGSKHIGVCYN